MDTGNALQDAGTLRSKSYAGTSRTESFVDLETGATSCTSYDKYAFLRKPFEKFGSVFLKFGYQTVSPAR